MRPVPLPSLAASAALVACAPHVIDVAAADAAHADRATADVATDVTRHPWAPVADRCLHALGRVSVVDGARCGAVLVAPGLALTAAPCLVARGTSTYAPASSITFTPHGAARPFAVRRVVHGRDVGDARAAGAWAALVLADAVPASLGEPAAIGPDVDRAAQVTVAGYSDVAAEVLRVAGPCELRRHDDDAAAHDCPEEPALGGGAVLTCDAGRATLRALTVPRGEGFAYNAVPLTHARAAPFAPTRLAVGPATAYGPAVYTLDASTGRVHVRVRDGARWSPWRAIDMDLPAALDVAAAGIRTVNLPYLLVLTTARQVWHVWSDWIDAAGFTIRSAASMDPVPGSARLVAIAATGGLDDRMQVYVADADGVVRATEKLSDDPLSGWSPWYEVGRAPGVAHLAAATYFGSDGPSRHVVASSPTGVGVQWSATTWGAGAWPSRGFVPFVRDARTTPAPLALGVARNGEPVMYRTSVDGVVLSRARLVDGSAWTDERPLDAQPGHGASALAAGRLPDGRALLAAIDRVTGEVLVAAEDEGPAGGFTRARWQRFYR